jgi:hypothetical protein
MNRYAIDHSRGRVVLPATDPDHARAKMAKLYGAGPYNPIRLPNANSATGVATTPKTMSKKNEKKTPPKPMDIGTKVMKLHKSIKAKEKAAKASLGEKVEKLAKAPKAKPAKEGMSGLDAAALVLREAKRAMNAKEIVAEIQERKLAPKLCGKTPHATIYAAMITEIAKSAEPRFKRGSAKGTFEHNTDRG